MRPLRKQSVLQSDINAVSLTHWCSKNIVNEKGLPIEFNRHKIMRSLYGNFSHNLVIKKSAQVGATTFALLKALHLSVYNNITTIYTMPKRGDISDFSQARINPIIRRSKLSIPINVDNVGLKHIGNSYIYFRGTWGEKEAISVPADVLIHDEIDRSKPDVIEMYRERLSASDIKIRILLSTPTIKNYGISKLFEESDQRLWIVSCPAGHKQVIRESNIRDGQFVCVTCGKVLDRANGQWEAQNSKSDIAGYHITQLIAPWISADEVIAKKNDYEFKRDYYNFVLGENYAGGEGLVTRLDIISLIKDIMPSDVSQCFVGVDWGDISWVVVRRNKAIIYKEKIELDTRKQAARVAEIIDKFKAKAVCDFGYGDIKNKELIEKFPRRVFMCVYTKDVLFPRLNEKEHKVNVDRTRSIQESLQEIKDGDLTICNDDLCEEFIRHFENLTEVTETDDHGKKRIVIGRAGDDHFVHANNYARLLQRKLSTVEISQRDKDFNSRQPDRVTAEQDF